MADNEIENELNKVASLVKRVMFRNESLSNSLSELKLLMGEIMSAELDRMIEELEENKTVTGSLMELTASLASRLREVAGDRVKTLQLATELDARNKEIADATVANTPSE